MDALSTGSFLEGLGRLERRVRVPPEFPREARVGGAGTSGDELELSMDVRASDPKSERGGDFVGESTLARDLDPREIDLAPFFEPMAKSARACSA